MLSPAQLHVARSGAGLEILTKPDVADAHKHLLKRISKVHTASSAAPMHVTTFHHVRPFVHHVRSR